MPPIRNTLLLLTGLLTLGSCVNDPENDTEAPGSQVLIECNQNLSAAQVERHFNPPVAARNYAYPNIATYIALQPFHSDYLPLKGQLNELELEGVLDSEKHYDQELIAFATFTGVALPLVYGDTIVSNYREKKLHEYQYRIEPLVYANSMEYSQAIVDGVLAWADKDLYRETRNYGEFAPSADQDKWKPTSPDYMAAIEPYWTLIRPFVLDSANQFEPERPTEVELDTASTFYSETMEVYYSVNEHSDEKKAIAQFWDCNPNISHHKGHFMFFLQKISPGGHWIHIALQVLDAEKQSLIEGAHTMALTSLTLHDAFIACWTEKYKSNYIRPETVIKNHIDKSWEPILQTPAFPEYPSGHSVASSSAATVLTAHIGEPYYFVDSTEVPYGLPRRTFNSFRQASNEAAISRLYGGIHFMPAIENGITMGNQVGELVLSRIQFKKQP